MALTSPGGALSSPLQALPSSPGVLGWTAIPVPDPTQSPEPDFRTCVPLFQGRSPNPLSRRPPTLGPWEGQGWEEEAEGPQMLEAGLRTSPGGSSCFCRLPPAGENYLCTAHALSG